MRRLVDKDRSQPNESTRTGFFCPLNEKLRRELITDLELSEKIGEVREINNRGRMNWRCEQRLEREIVQYPIRNDIDLSFASQFGKHWSNQPLIESCREVDIFGILDILHCVTESPDHRCERSVKFYHLDEAMPSCHGQDGDRRVSGNVFQQNGFVVQDFLLNIAERSKACLLLQRMVGRKLSFKFPNEFRVTLPRIEEGVLPSVDLCLVSTISLFFFLSELRLIICEIDLKCRFAFQQAVGNSRKVLRFRISDGIPENTGLTPFREGERYCCIFLVVRAFQQPECKTDGTFVHVEREGFQLYF